MILMQIPSAMQTTILQQNLERLMADLTLYCEGIRSHPFMEEVVLLYSAH